jgi:hypothetical protein
MARRVNPFADEAAFVGELLDDLFYILANLEGADAESRRLIKVGERRITDAERRLFGTVKRRARSRDEFR